MVKLEFIRDMGNLIPYPVFHECNPGVFVQHEIGNLRLVPIFPVIPPTKEVEADEEDTVEAEQEAYDNGLDPELDYPAIESECVSTKEEECAVVSDVQGKELWWICKANRPRNNQSLTSLRLRQHE